MGHRANFVVVRDGHARVYSDQWAGLGCAYFLADGPNKACETASGFEPADELMDWACAEGGYLIDFDEKKVITFGCPVDLEDFADGGEDGEEFGESEPSFAEGGLPFLQHIAPNWVGWKLVWDERGVDAFAAHLKGRGITDIATQPESHPPDIEPPVEHQA
jgi:hypothetical protein